MIEETYNYEPYILNDSNMQTYLKYKLINLSNNKYEKFENKINISNNISNNITPKTSIFFPREQDSLFWCYYIISNGDTNYEMLNNKNLLVARQLKIDYISKIRENKQIVKTYKFDTITNIESNLANENNINIQTVITLCAIDKINILFVKRKTYFELLMNDNKPIYIIKEIDNQSKYSKKYGFEIGNPDIIQDIKSTLYKIENLDKPIKGLSSYKVQDLINICMKLAIQIKNIDTGKNKTKNDLYESIIQYF